MKNESNDFHTEIMKMSKSEIAWAYIHLLKTHEKLLSVYGESE